jgi:mannobiose 2-epimerase
MYTFSAAYRVTGDPSYLRIATRAKDYCIEYFIDKEFGAAYSTLDYKGVPISTGKQLYTNAYFIYGFAEYARATGDREALEAAKSIFELFEEHAFDKEYNGYFEEFNHEWERVHLRMLGTADIDDKTQNTSLQILLAYTNLYRVFPEARMAERLRNLVELFLDKIINPDTYQLYYIMDRYMNNISGDRVSFGHDIEAAWFLRDAAVLLNDPQLLKRVEDASVKMAEAVEKAIQPDGSLFNTLGTGSGNRSWWPQVEAIVGYFDAWEISGEEKFLDIAINNWNYTRDHFIDRVNGGWFTRVNADGEVSGDKAASSGGVCPYHNSRMSMEIMERVERLQKRK